MSYIIRELSTEDRAKTSKTLEVVEVGFEHIRLDLCDTEEDAKASIMQWEATDELTDDISDFIKSMIEKYEERLTNTEIREIIKEH